MVCRPLLAHAFFGPIRWDQAEDGTFGFQPGEVDDFRGILMDVYADRHSFGVYIDYEAVADNHSIATFSTRLAVRVEMYVQRVHIRLIFESHKLLLLLRA